MAQPGPGGGGTFAPPPPPPPPPPPVFGDWGEWRPPPPPPQAEPPLRRRTLVLLASSLVAAVVLAAGGAVWYARVAPHSAAHSGAASPSPASVTSPAPDLSALTAQPSTPGVTVDPAEAASVVRAVWPAREEALFVRDAATVTRLETGSAAAWDTIRCTFGCPPPSPRPLEELRTFVPRETTYPAAFLAEVRTTTDNHAQPYIEIMVLSRESAHEPWRVALDTGYAGIDHFNEAPMTDGGGFDAVVQPPAGVDPSQLPAELAAYWQHWKDDGSPPPATTFQDGTWTTEQGQSLYAAKQEYAAHAQVERTTYSADPQTDGLWRFAIIETTDGLVMPGWSLTCGTVHYSAVVTPATSGGALIQSAMQTEWGTLLPPGSYSQITNIGLHQSCFLLQPGYPDVGVVGGNGGVVKVVGTTVTPAQ